MFDKGTANLAIRLANIFTSLKPDHMDTVFQNTRQMQQSKADKVVAIEMMHVKLFEESYKLKRIGKSSEFEL